MNNFSTMIAFFKICFKIYFLKYVLKITLIKQFCQVCEIVSSRWLKQAFICICLVLYPPSHCAMQLGIQCGSNARVEGFPKFRPADVVPIDSERVSDYVLLILQPWCCLGFSELILVYLNKYWNLIFEKSLNMYVKSLNVFISIIFAWKFDH